MEKERKEEKRERKVCVYQCYWRIGQVHYFRTIDISVTYQAYCYENGSDVTEIINYARIVRIFSIG